MSSLHPGVRRICLTRLTTGAWRRFFVGNRNKFHSVRQIKESFFNSLVGNSQKQSISSKQRIFEAKRFLISEMQRVCVNRTRGLHRFPLLLFLTGAVCVMHAEESSSNDVSMETLEKGITVKTVYQGLDVTAIVDYANEDGTYDLDLGQGHVVWRVKRGDISEIPSGS